MLIGIVTGPSEQLTKSSNQPPLGLSGDNRSTGICLLTNSHIQWQLTYQWHLILTGNFITTTLAKYRLRMTSLGANMQAHIFDNT